MARIRKQSTGNYAVTVPTLDDDGSPVSVTSPTISVVDGAGTVKHTGSATYASGALSASVPASALPYLDAYVITWSGTVSGTATTWTSTLELVGGYLFEIADLRALDRAFADVVKYPSALLRAVRDAVEATIEGPRAAQVAFVPRGARVTLDGTSPDLSRGFNPLLYGTDTRVLQAPDFELRDIISVKINGDALDQTGLDALTADDNRIHRPTGWPHGHRNIEIHYTHGRDQAPGPITRAALILAREYLAKTDLPGRATSTTVGDQTFRLTIAGRDGTTGLPEVDAAIDQHGRKGYAVG